MKFFFFFYDSVSETQVRKLRLVLMHVINSLMHPSWAPKRTRLFFSPFQFNFVGRILGPRGMTAKQLEQETGCKIMIRGKGSMRDKKKVSECRIVSGRTPQSEPGTFWSRSNEWAVFLVLEGLIERVSKQEHRELILFLKKAHFRLHVIPPIPVPTKSIH